MSTRLKKREAERMIRTCSRVIGKIKTQHKNPVIICAGDFNNFDVSTLLEDYEDLKSTIALLPEVTPT